MKKITCLLFVLALLFNSCEKKEFDRIDFLRVESGAITTSTTESVSLESEILGVSAKKVAEHGYVFSCLHELPTLTSPDTESKLLGVKLEGGLFSATIENLDYNTTYSIRAFALLEGELEAAYGEVLTFRSSDFSLQVTTDSFEFVVGGFELFGTVRNLEPGVVLEKYGFVWSNENEQPNLENDTPVYLGSIDMETSFSRRETDVEALKRYYVRSFASIGKDVFYGETISFYKGDVWRQKTNLEKPLDGTYHTSVNGKGYVGGGYGPPSGSSREIRSYDPTTEQWTVEAELETLCNNGSAFTIGDSLYVVSGNDGIGTALWLYNTIDKTWEQRADFDQPQRNFAVAESVNGMGYLGMGGIIGGQHTSELWRYDPTTNSWMQMPSFPAAARIEPTIFSSDTELYIGFGFQKNDLYAFDVETMTWTEKAPIPDAQLLSHNFDAMRIEDKAYVLAGVPTDNFWAYDMATNTWAKKAKYPGVILNDPVLFEINGKGYLCMGVEEATGSGNNVTVWEYIPDSK